MVSYIVWAFTAAVPGPVRLQSNDWLAGDLRVAFAREQGGDVLYMAPASSVPAEVSAGHVGGGAWGQNKLRGGALVGWAAHGQQRGGGVLG